MNIAGVRFEYEGFNVSGGSAKVASASVFLNFRRGVLGGP
jgi:hypothetical protein